MNQLTPCQWSRRGSSVSPGMSCFMTARLLDARNSPFSAGIKVEQADEPTGIGHDDLGTDEEPAPGPGVGSRGDADRLERGDLAGGLRFARSRLKGMADEGPGVTVAVVDALNRGLRAGGQNQAIRQLIRPPVRLDEPWPSSDDELASVQESGIEGG